MSTFLASTPLLFALLGLGFSVLWQCCGSFLLWHVMCRVFDRAQFAFLMAWIAFPVLVAAFGLVLSFVKWEWAVVGLRLGLAGIFGGAIGVGVRGGHFARARARWRVLGAEAGARWGLRLTLIYGGVFLLVAAFPQELYDQFNYHLVITKWIAAGRPLSEAADNHLLMTGVYEYGLFWARALWNHDVFAWSVGQSTTFLIFCGTLLLVTWEMGKRAALSASAQMFLLAFVLMVVPYNLPESSLYRLFKPDGLLLSMMLAVLSSWILETRKDALKGSVIAVLLMVALKLTAGHGVVALVLTVAGLWGVRGKVRALGERRAEESAKWAFLSVAAVSGAAVILVFAKNYFLLGNPFYPAAQSHFESAYTDATTIAYWKSVAGTSGREWFAGFWGYVGLLKQMWPVAVLIVAGGFFVERAELRKWVVPAGVFSIVFALLWPWLFSSDIFPRFVAAGLAGVVMLFVVGAAALVNVAVTRAAVGLEGRQGTLRIVLLAAALGLSGMDTLVSRVWKWSLMSVPEYLRKTVESYGPSELTNKFLDDEQIILADTPAKYLFQHPLLFASESAGVRERKIFAEWLENQAAAEKKYHIGAIITASPSELELHMMLRTCATKYTTKKWNTYILAGCGAQ